MGTIVGYIPPKQDFVPAEVVVKTKEEAKEKVEKPKKASKKEEK